MIPIANQSDTYYTPVRINRWLRDWPLLVTLAETPRSSRHYLTLEHQYRQGPCAETMRLEQRARAYHGDDLAYADIKADIEAAWNALGPVSHPFRLIYLIMQRYGLRDAEGILRMRHGMAPHVYRLAVMEMARYLGWAGD